MKTTWPRKASAQIARMAKIWPELVLVLNDDECLAWRGRIRGAQKDYEVGLVWLLDGKLVPIVTLIDPKLAPRKGGTFDEIPHLLRISDDPEKSALCLFHSAGRDWDNTMMIADTIVPWAGRWLFYYELWLVDGIWRGGGIGPESVAAAAAGLH